MPHARAATPVAHAGLLRDRQQSEKSQGFGDRVPESFRDQNQTKTVGKSTLTFSTNGHFTLNQYTVVLQLKTQVLGLSLRTEAG